MTEKILLNAKGGTPAAQGTGGGRLSSGVPASGGVHDAGESNGEGGKERKTAAGTAANASAASGSSGGSIEMSLSYVQFQSVADSVKETLDKVASRVAWGKEYGVVLNECRQAYFRQRRTLLLDTVRARVEAAVVEGKDDLGVVARQGCSILCDVCHREYKLLQRFIPSVDTGDGNGLDVLMSPLCDTLVDVLRPLYLKVVDVDQLCALAVILKGEVLEEQIELRGASLGAMRACVGMLLHEVQERLTFRAQMYIRDEIQAYAPSKVCVCVYVWRVCSVCAECAHTGICVTECCSVIQCCKVVQWVSVCFCAPASVDTCSFRRSVLQFVAVRCSMMQCVAVRV